MGNGGPIFKHFSCAGVAGCVTHNWGAPSCSLISPLWDSTAIGSAGIGRSRNSASWPWFDRWHVNRGLYKFTNLDMLIGKWNGLSTFGIEVIHSIFPILCNWRLNILNIKKMVHGMYNLLALRQWRIGMINLYLLGALEHEFYFSIIYGII